ncbi:unnamed protein product [Colias eurytheme]|nr:unnamed protein product [Colias eurytheme]
MIKYKGVSARLETFEFPRFDVTQPLLSRASCCGRAGGEPGAGGGGGVVTLFQPIGKLREAAGSFTTSGNNFFINRREDSATFGACRKQIDFKQFFPEVRLRAAQKRDRERLKI